MSAPLLAPLQHSLSEPLVPAASEAARPGNAVVPNAAGRVGAAGKPVTGVPVGGGPSGSSWHTDTSPGTYPNPNAPSSGQGRPPAV